MSFPTREVCTNLIKKMCADPPYSQTGLRQPIVPYVEAYAQRRSTSMVLCLLIKIPVRGRSSSGNQSKYLRILFANSVQR